MTYLVKLQLGVDDIFLCRRHPRNPLPLVTLFGHEDIVVHLNFDQSVVNLQLGFRFKRDVCQAKYKHAEYEPNAGFSLQQATHGSQNGSQSPLIFSFDLSYDVL